MTSAKFKSGINAELKAAGFTNKMTKLEEDPSTYQNILTFEKALDEPTAQWLNRRFTHGITLCSGVIGNVCFINPPNHNK